VRVSLDFETASEVELKKVGGWAYAAHPSTHILCAAWAVDDGPVKSVRFDGPDSFAELLELYFEDATWCAFNAGFEFAIWYNILYLKHKLWCPKIHQWRDSAAVSMMHSLPRQMGDVAKALKLPHLKDEDGKKVMMKMCKPLPENQRESNGGSKWYRKEDAWQTLLEYCEDDVLVEREITRRLGDLPEYEQRIWEYDLRVNVRGIRIDQDLAVALSDRKKQVCDKLKKECIDAYGFSPSQVGKLKEFLVANGVPVPTKMKWKKDKKTGETTKQSSETLGGEVIKALLVEDIPANVKHALTLRREFATTSIAKADAVLRQCVNGIACYQFLYHGANTGRWSGKGIQLHNLPRGEFDEDWVDEEMHLACQQIKDEDSLDFFDISEMNVLKSALRGLIIPRPGKALTVIDFAQIEARVLAWLAGQQEVLDAFIAGKDLYKFTAAQIYSKDYDDIEKPERFIGKTASLALGYQGGAGAFIGMATNFGVKVEKALAEKVKTDWRDRNGLIVKFWYCLQKAALRCAKTGTPTKYRGIRFRKDKGFLRCILPSGRSIYYYDPRVKMIDTDWGQKESLTYMGSDQQRNIQWGRINTYGGKLAENCLAGNSEILTPEGWIKLKDYSPSVHLVWDGEEMVQGGELLDRGVKRTIVVNGVEMTPDHLILSDKGEWHAAARFTTSASEGLNWKKVRTPDSTKSVPLWLGEGLVGRCLRTMWRQNRTTLERVSEKAWAQSSELRLRQEHQDRQGKHYTWNELSPRFCCVEIDEGAMYGSETQSLQKLRGEGDNCDPRMVVELREFLGRYGAVIQGGLRIGPQGQRLWVFQAELSLGDESNQRQQQAINSFVSRHSYQRGRNGATVRHWYYDAPLSSIERMASGKTLGQTRIVQEDRVFDIQNCGPRNRFVVRAPGGGEPMIVHNCTQAVARDLLAEAMLRLREAGIDTIGHVHDELILEGDIGTIDYEYAVDIMTELPDWADGLPIGADGFQGQRYRK